MILRFGICFLLFGLISSFVCSPRAHAITGMEAALTVGGGALAGGILGASTLPFYSEYNEHTQNIWVGAAIGAVTGVIIAAAQGFAQTNEDLNDEQNAALLKSKQRSLEFSPALAGSHRNSDVVLAWQPLATLKF